MAGMADLEAKVAKAIGEARTAFAALSRDIGPIVQRLDKGEVDPGKTEAAARKVLAVMGKFAPITKLQGSAAARQLPDATQEQLLALDTLMNDLNNIVGRLQKAKGLVGEDPVRKAGALIDESRKTIRSAPAGVNFKGAGKLLKIVEQGVKAGSPEGKALAALPLALLLVMIWFTISRGLAAMKAVKGGAAKKSDSDKPVDA